MSRHGWRRYDVEIFIALVGAVVAILQATLTDNRDLLLVVIVITLLLVVTSVGLKSQVADLLRDDIARTVETIDRLWQADARREVGKLHAELREWAEGRRLFRDDPGTAYQVGVVRRTKKSLYAIHLALGPASLRRWDNQTGEFSEFVAAHEKLGRKVKRRRILVLDDTQEDLLVITNNGHRCLTDELVIRVCRRQMSHKKGGLQFDLRILWKSDVEASHDRLPPDLLVSDGVEAIVVRDVSQFAGSVNYEVEAHRSNVRVDDYLQVFEDYWSVAVPAARLLPQRPAVRLFHPSTWFSADNSETS